MEKEKIIKILQSKSDEWKNEYQNKVYGDKAWGAWKAYESATELVKKIMDKNKYSSDMEQEIENILLNSSLTDGEVSRLTNELLNLFSVSGSLPTDVEITDWVCNKFKIDGLDFDEDVNTQNGYLPEYFKSFAKWILSNER
jgi:hypothetical protein